MGLESAGLVLAAISAGATIAKGSAEAEAASADLSALNTQAKLQSLQFQQKNMKNLELTDKMLSKQAAQLSVRGVAFDSPSFNAIQRETLNIGGRTERNLKTEQSLAEQSIAIERHNVKKTLHSKLFGDAASFAFGAVTFAEKFPKSGKLPQAEDL